MKTIRVLSLVLVAAALAVTVFAAVPGALDGKSFDVTMKLADGQIVQDTYTFKNGMVESVMSLKQGYPAGPYSTTVEGQKTMVTGELKNDKGDSRTVRATIVGQLMDGTVDVTEGGKMTALTITSKATAPKKT
jgi:hypothetical protein